MVWYRKELLSKLKSVKIKTRLKGRRVNGDSADILASAGLPRVPDTSLEPKSEKSLAISNIVGQYSCEKCDVFW